MKALAAAITGRWVVSPEWVRQCYKQKKFINESPFGYKREDNVMKDKKFYFSPTFRKENERSKQQKLTHCTTLIEMVKNYESKINQTLAWKWKDYR